MKTISHTPGPWFVGVWGGMCHIAAHGNRHPGPPECVYDPIRHEYEPETGAFLGIAAENGVTVVGTEYDELVISPADARLIAAAPDLLEACRLAELWLANCVPVVELVGPKPLPIIHAAIAKATGTDAAHPVSVPLGGAQG